MELFVYCYYDVYYAPRPPWRWEYLLDSPVAAPNGDGDHDACARQTTTTTATAAAGEKFTEVSVRPGDGVTDDRVRQAVHRSLAVPAGWLAGWRTGCLARAGFGKPTSCPVALTAVVGFQFFAPDFRISSLRQHADVSFRPSHPG